MEVYEITRNTGNCTSKSVHISGNIILQYIGISRKVGRKRAPLESNNLKWSYAYNFRKKSANKSMHAMDMRQFGFQWRLDGLTPIAYFGFVVNVVIKSVSLSVRPPSRRFS